MSLNSAWQRFLPKDEELKEEINESAVAGKRFIAVLVARLEAQQALERKQMSTNKNFKRAAWPFQQAHSLGTQETYQKVIDILTKLC